MILKILLLLGFLLMIDEALTLDDLKVDYYEKLILKGIQDAQNYKPRTDNSDFFQNVKDEDPIYDFGVYDFIIVGAGSAGSVLASRLADIKKWNILLLEAGTDETDFSKIPGVHNVVANTFKNWGYHSVPQENGCLGMIDHRCPYTRGLSIGGTSATGGIIYSRGSPEDYNSWARLGNTGWSYDDVKPYFEKLELLKTNSNNPEGTINSEETIDVNVARPISKFHKTFVEAWKNVSLGGEKIFNGDVSTGIGEVEYHIRDGKRLSSASAYLNKPQKNLNITKECLATKILIDKTTKAYGVEFQCKNGNKYKALAKKEVLLSGGAVNTPQLLMLSGVGPKDELNKHNITLIKNLPVGQYLKDHVGYLSLSIKTNYTEPKAKLEKLIEDYLSEKGLLTKTLNIDSVAYLNVDNPSDKKPNMEYIFVPPRSSMVGLFSTRNFNPDVIKTFLQTNDISTDIFVSVTLLHPKSIGKITLASSDPKDFPLIDLGLCSNNEDVKTLYKGIQVALKMLKTEQFEALNASFSTIPEPCKQLQFGSKDFWYCCIKTVAFGAHQLTSTTKMGPVSDPLAVVDHNLKVHGIKNLRIVDCGIVPVTMSGQLNAVAFMLGEKAADLIKQEHLKTEQHLPYYQGSVCFFNTFVGCYC